MLYVITVYSVLNFPVSSFFKEVKGCDNIFRHSGQRDMVFSICILQIFKPLPCQS